ncbi:pyridoxal phosphate-dependent aminotransferase family protein [Actinoplanes couchii]|uniref:8-amino-7-oxononanoate synthase n=1 Tax=Actinoplanes couchii TaxID=403638 RepID=A0ABQ3XTR8_9ACTN|nr:2-amino-3-ketobutyrate CoA ligase [Actinoplanes couchii]
MVVSHYERSLFGGPGPRVEMSVGGIRRSVVNLGSYNYLGLADHPDVVAAAADALGRYGTGACGSPMLSGMTDLHRELEHALSGFLGRASTMLFTSGYAGAAGVLAGLLRRGDIAVLDSRAHVSLRDGARLSGARAVTFAHNSPEALDGVLSRTGNRRRLVVVEGVYSMDGNLADLPGLLAVAERHGVGMLVDEAHSMLTCGPGGAGVVAHFGVQDRVALVYGTFSKAFAGVGGFVSGGTDTIDYLRCYAGSYGFSCALPPSVVGALIAALRVAAGDDGPRRRLVENAAYFRAGLHRLGLDTGDSTTQVVPILVGADRRLLYERGDALLRAGLFVVPADYPAVPRTSVRFRASVTAGHSRDDLDEALSIIESVWG